jgi:polysaccharide pyruvyl transferase WcaK-like protein
MTDHLKKCRAIIVREQESFSYLREIIGLKDNVYLAADPAFVMEPEPFEFPFLNQHSIAKLLAMNFSLAPMQHIYGHMPVKKFQADLVLCVQKLLDALPIRVLLVPHVGDDYGFLTPIFKTLSKQYLERIQILPEKIGAQKTKWAVSQANALLTMRFHCSLAGFSTNTPTMVLISTSKGAKMCKEMYGDMEYTLNIRDMDSDTLILKIRSLLDHEEAIRTRLTPACEKMKERAFGAGDILSKVL